MEVWRSELYHYGIKGQKWGVRRYQNQDGTYTLLGKRRRGKMINRSYNSAYEESMQNSRKRSRKYQQAKNEQDRLKKVYDLDENGNPTERLENDSIFGGNYSRVVSQNRAAQRYWEQGEEMSALDEKFRQKAKKYAEETILKEYGSTAITEMDTYRDQNAVMAFIAAVLAGGTIIYASNKIR